MTTLTTVCSVLSRWGRMTSVHCNRIAALLFGWFVHSAAHIARVWLV
jgi:hypothetical protein